MNRKVLACTLIVVAAVVVIVTTAVLRAGGDDARPAAEQPVAPALTSSTLTEAEVRSALGDNAFVTSSRFSRLSKDPVKVDPATCIGVSMILANDLLSGFDWLALRGAVGSSPQGQSSHYVAQGIAALDTPEAARDFLKKAAQTWQKCNGKSYSADASGTVGHWVMKTFEQTESTLTAGVAQENSRYLCQRVLSVHTKYIIDVAACGYDIVDQAQVVVNRITGKLVDNLENP